MMPAPCAVLLVVRAVLLGDWVLARYAARQAVAARAMALWDDGADIELPEAPRALAAVHALRVRNDLDERPRRMVGAERGSA